MLSKLWFKPLGISRRDFTLVFILLFNTVTWYFTTLMWTNRLLSEISFENLEPLILTVYNAAIIFAGFVSLVFSTRFSRTRFLFFWMLLGTVASWLPILLGMSTATSIVVFSALLGVSFGIGLPSCFSYFADHTVIDNRGTVAGVVLLVSNLSAMPIVVSFVAFNLDLVSISLFSGFWRLAGLVLFLLLKPSEGALPESKDPSPAGIPEGRGFTLYLIPWLMFSLVNGLEAPIVSHSLGSTFSEVVTVIAPLIGGVSAFVAGFFADKMGRKRVVMIGFVTLGLAYAVLGLASQEIAAKYLYAFADSWSGGIFLTLFFLVLWGDLARTGSKERYYAAGTALNYLTFIIGQLSVQYVEIIPASAAFSFAAFFLFLAVLPLMYAPETVPESKIKLMELKNYVEQAKKLTQKYPKKDEPKS